MDLTLDLHSKFSQQGTIPRVAHNVSFLHFPILVFGSEDPPYTRDIQISSNSLSRAEEVVTYDR